MRRLLFVCKGNVFRSPFAAAVCGAMVERQSLLVECRSAGTEAYHVGEGAHIAAVEVAIEWGMDLGGHVARQVEGEDVRWATDVVAMEEVNMQRLRERWEKELARASVGLLGDWGYDGRGIPDPYRRGKAAVRESFGIIVRCVEGLVRTFD